VKSLGAGKAGVEVLYDKEQITEGERWREVINAMLAECDAAVILITPEALKSPWVLKESTILRWRYDRDPSFPLLPVVYSKIDRTKLKKHRLWNPIDLPAIQFLASDDIAKIASSVKKTLAPLASQLQPAPLDLLADQIALSLAKASPKNLRRVTQSLQEPIPADFSDERHRLAYALARWSLRQTPPALERMAATLALLGKSFPADNACEILELIAPMWVELDAASWFVRANLRHAGLRDLAIACVQPAQTVSQYVDRAYMPSRPPPLWLLNGLTGGAHVEDVARELRKVLRPRLEIQRKRALSDAEIDDFLKTTNTRFYIALPLPDDRQVVTELQRRYERMTLVFFVQPEQWAEAPPVGAGVGWVDPRLDPQLEEHISRDHDDALALFL
jgi:hypothetical protein